MSTTIEKSKGSYFTRKLREVSEKNNSLLCVGLDPVLSVLPTHLQNGHKNATVNTKIFEFNKKIIDATHDLVCAFKPNLAFYEAQGKDGWIALNNTCAHIRQYGIPIILDGKRGDIGNTARMYAQALLELLQADAVTVNPYYGWDCISEFLNIKNKFVFVLCLSSNDGAKDFQTIELEDGTPLYEKVALKVKDWNDEYSNLGLVVGAMYTKQLQKIRSIASDMPLLIPGVGKQGGVIEDTVIYGTDEEGDLAIINSSRDVIYASNDKDFAEKAREKALSLRESINRARQKKLSSS